MKLVNQFPIYELGGSLGVLKDVCGREVTDPFEQIYPIWIATKNLGEIIEGDQPLDFCRKAAMDLLGELEKKRAEIAKQKDESPVVQQRWQMRSVADKIEVFEHQLSAELGRTASYCVPTKGIFNSELLAEHAYQHIHESIREKLSPFAVDEYREAGRCLAFGLYSASGFHSARAVEDVLRVYYERFIGPPPDKPMGLLASHLGDLLKKKDAIVRPSENTIRHIKDITNFDRNPLIHRGVKLEEMDATTLFNGALGVIVEMVKEMSSMVDQQEALLLNEPPQDEPVESSKKKTRRITSKKALQISSKPS